MVIVFGCVFISGCSRVITFLCDIKVNVHGDSFIVIIYVIYSGNYNVSVVVAQWYIVIVVVF